MTYRKKSAIGDNPLDGVIPRQEKNKADKPVKQKTIKPAKNISGDMDIWSDTETENDPSRRVKVTYTLPEETINDLEEWTNRLKRKAPRQQKTKINRGAIVDLALRMAFEDLEQNGPDSRYYIMLVNHIYG